MNDSKKYHSLVLGIRFLFISYVIATLLATISLNASNYDASKTNLTYESGYYSSLEKRSEEELLTKGSPRLFFDKNYQPSDTLLKLLEITGMHPLNPEEKPIEQINRWAQKNFLRQGERWEEQTNKFEELEPTIKPLLKELGFVDALTPCFKQYEGAIVHGALLSRIRLRLYYLVEQWNQGVRFSHLYFLGGERPLEAKQENRITLTQNGDSPLKIREDWMEPEELPKTEYEMMQLVWDQSEIPEAMREQVKVYFINAPMKMDPINGKLLRPTTNDTVEYWLKTHPPFGCYLAITNAPYINRQDLAVRVFSPRGYDFDTIGLGASKNEKVAIFLDELARFIYQIRSLYIETNLE
jgi:hypothetical protein